MPSGLKNKTVLLFCPKYFNYEIEIRKSLDGLGAITLWYDERPSNSFLTKVLIRLSNKILPRKIEKYYKGIINELETREVQPDFIFFVNPESAGKEQIFSLKKYAPQAKLILYMWDSIKNKKNATSILSYFDSVSTFDPVDAEEYGMKLRPLFYTNKYVSEIQTGLEYDFLFIGTAHSDRYLLVKKIIENLPSNLIVKTHFFLSSRKLFWLKKMLHREFRKVKLDEISFLPLDQQSVAKLVGKSKIIIDINHPQQIGLTMRTFETLGANRKLVTTNEDVVNYDFFRKENIYIINRDNPVIPDEFIKQNLIPLENQILFKYSIEGWISELFAYFIPDLICKQAEE
jgi:hypothetical protein